MKRFVVCLAFLVSAMLVTFQAEANWPASCQQAYESKDNAERLRLYTECIASGYAEKYVFNNRGNAYKALGQYQLALEDYSRALEIDPRYAYALNGRGNVYRSLGQEQRAIEDYDRAIELDPNYPLPFNGRGNAYHALGQEERAIRDYDRALELNPNYHYAFNGRGTAFDALGQYERAIQDYDRAIELAPDYALAFNNRGYAYRQLGQHQRALQEYNRALELDPNLKLAFFNRCQAYLDQGRFMLVLKEYERVLAQEPDNAELLNGKAWLLATSSNPAFLDAKEAVELATRACALKETANYLDTLAAAQARAGRYGEAVSTQEKSIAKAKAEGELDRKIAEFSARLDLYHQGMPYTEK